MGIACVMLAVVALLLCAIGLCWDGFQIYEADNQGQRGHALFHLLKTAVVVPTIVLLLFVFGAHMRCNDKESNWEPRPHCQEGTPKPVRAEAEAQGGQR